MKKLMIIIILMLFSMSAFGQKSYIVVLKKGSSQENMASYASIRGRIKKQLPIINGFTIPISNAQELSELRNDPSVSYIEEDGKVYPQTIEPNVYWTLSLINNRTLVFTQPFSYEYFNTGQGVDVYILDSGILTYHPDFSGRVREGWTIRKGKRVDQSQCGGHGTEVAGVVGGTITGIAKEVNLVSVTMTDCNVGYALVSDVIKAISYVARQKGTKIANISYAGYYQQSVYDAIESAYQKGVVFTLAAGNEGTNACNDTPAAAPDAITISGVQENGYDDNFNGGVDPNWTGFNYGQCVDAFAALGGWTDWYDNTGNVYTGGFLGGTSFSAPHAAGIAALYLEQHPNATAQEVINGVLSQATPGILHINGPGSPNLLLYSKVN